MTTLRSKVALAFFALAISPLAAAQQCCVPDVTTYCTAGTTVHGCVPAITGIGSPSALTPSGFTIKVTSVPGQRTGVIFYGFYQLVTPWAPGSFSYKCIANPIGRTGNQSSGGTAGLCDGVLSVPFNAWMASNGGALGSPFVAGQVFHAQGWFRDPGAPKQTNLSNALRFVLDGCAATPPGMAEISAGTFFMGSTAQGQPPCNYGTAQQPVHQVTLSYCFWMGTTEVTQAQYAALMGTNPSHFQGTNLPVERVSWFDAQDYCAALTAQQSALGAVPSGYQYRLPTEAEWEYACRAGTTTEFNVGPNLLCAQAKFGAVCASNTACNSSTTVPVGSYAANGWGLYDMHGNVWEWCLDSWTLYTADAVTDPFSGGGNLRDFRGGGWASYDYPSRSAHRAHQDPNFFNIDIGFRVVLAPVLVP